MTKQQHYPPTCPICGASLPHDNPMARDFHEQQWQAASDRRIFEIKSVYADEPEMNHTYYFTLREVQRVFPKLFDLVKPTEFHHLSYTVNLHRIEVEVSAQ